MMGRFPWGSDRGIDLASLDADADAVAVDVAVCVFVEPNDPELDTSESPVTDDVVVVLYRLYLDPGTPGLVGSSRWLGLLDSNTTTRSMAGRNCGSDCTQSNPICTSIAICSVSADDTNTGSMISKLLCFL